MTFQKSLQGSCNHLRGQKAENLVAKKYMQSGFEICETRCRRETGEIDLIARHKRNYYFIEVKRAKTHEIAAHRITSKQQSRIRQTAEVYLSELGFDPDREVRFDAALVDALANVRIIPNAF